jgi:hypothetical protein
LVLCPQINHARVNPENITECAAKEFVESVKANPVARKLLQRMLTEGGIKALPKWLTKIGGRYGSRAIPVIGWILLVGDAVFGGDGTAY